LLGPCHGSTLARSHPSDAEDLDRWTPDAGIVRGYRALLLAILDRTGHATANALLGAEMTSERNCTICHERQAICKGRCHRCDVYWRTHGRERPTGIG
jgi:hypothetical protein